MSGPGKYTMSITKEMACAQSDLRASRKMACEVCKKINRRRFAEAKNFMEKLVKQEVDIDGVYYTKAAEGILKFLKTLEFNAKNRDMDPETMRLNISAHQGPRMLRGRRNRHHGMRLKMTKLQAVLIPAKKKKEKTKEAPKEEKPGKKEEKAK